MFKYKGKTLNVKEEKSGVECKWYTFKQGNLVPEHLVELVKIHGGEVEKIVEPIVEVEPEQIKPEPVKKKVVKKRVTKK